MAKLIFTIFIFIMNIKPANMTFGQKYPTSKVLEITTQRILDSDGMAGYIETIKQMYGEMPKYIGCGGYKKYAKILGEKITAKYPTIAEATNQIIELTGEISVLSKNDFLCKIRPIIEKFDKEIDIVI